MIPCSDATVWRRLPPHELHLPADDLVDEETGIGGFHHTFLIRNVAATYAAEAVAYEKRLIEAIDLTTATEEEFELLVSWIESGRTDDHEDLGDLAGRLDPLDGLVYYAESPLGWLELGVSGLSYAIGSMGGIPAASCRGHFGKAASHKDDVAHVTFACAQDLGGLLLVRCEELDCGFDFADDLGLMQIWAPDLRRLNELASALLQE